MLECNVTSSRRATQRQSLCLTTLRRNLLLCSTAQDLRFKWSITREFSVASDVGRLQNTATYSESRHWQAERWIMIPMISLHFTFFWPCISIYLCNKNLLDAVFILNWLSVGRVYQQTVKWKAQHVLIVVYTQYTSWWWATNMSETCRGWVTK